MSSRPDKPELRLDWCSYEAAKYAVEHWHYSRTMPAGRNVYVGVWEGEKFIGAVMFGMGSGNSTNGRAYGLRTSHEMAELVRVALAKHCASVTRIVAIAIRFIRKQSPGLRLLISMADPAHGHHGGIYQGGGWIYTGKTASDYLYQNKAGQFVHHRSAGSERSLVGVAKIPIPGKFRYLMPLDDEMRRRIEPLRKPYPKRAGSIDADAPVIQTGEGGSTPTPALQLQAAT